MADTAGKVIDQHHGDNWSLWHGDCIDVTRGLPDDSLHYTCFSPPFASLYTFSDDPRDVSNNNSDAVFWRHFGFLIAELHRVTMPGRLVSIHCMNLPTSKLRDGFIGLRDFRGDIIRAFQAAGFVFHSEVVIRKDPVAAMQRTKALGLLHKQIVKDSSMSRMAIPDYLVTMRKLGDNPEPIAGQFDRYFGEQDHDAFLAECRRSWTNMAENRRMTWEDWVSVNIWQRYAEPVWMDINQSDVLSRWAARAEEDERHISPLQIQVIRRALQIWTMPGDVVFSPFAGIGSELWVALDMGRKALGAELKRSYVEQAVANLTGWRPASRDLFTAAS